MSFKVGDKVKHAGCGDGVVRFGPFKGAHTDSAYLVEFEKYGMHRTTGAAFLTPRPAFAVGDTVRFDGTEDVTITYGPYRLYNGVETYVVRFKDGHESSIQWNYLSPAPAATPLAVGDQIRILVDDPTDDEVRAGDVYTVSHVYDGIFRVTAGWTFEVSHEGTGWERVTDTATIDGVTYDLSARYEDQDGDAWRLRLVDGVVRATTSCALVFPNETSMTLSHVARNYGPLTKVTT